MRGLIKVTKRTSRFLNWISGWSLVAMMCLSCADIVLRLFRHPILGTYEIVGFLGAMVAAFAVAQTTIERGHVAVELIVMKFPARLQKTIYIITLFLSLFLFIVLSWESVRYGNDFRASGEVSMVLGLPFYYVVYGIAFSAAVVSVIIIIDILMITVRGAEPWQLWEE